MTKKPINSRDWFYCEACAKLTKRFERRTRTLPFQSACALATRPTIITLHTLCGECFEEFNESLRLAEEQGGNEWRDELNNENK